MSLKKVLLYAGFLSLLFSTDQARSDLQVKIDRAGANQVFFDISGTINTIGSAPAGTPASNTVFDRTFGNPSLIINRIPASAHSRELTRIPGFGGSTGFLAGTLPAEGAVMGSPAVVSMTGYRFAFDNIAGEFSGIYYSANPFTGGLKTISDLFVIDIPFTTFNPGTYIFGRTTDAVSGNGVTLIVSGAGAAPGVTPLNFREFIRKAVEDGVDNILRGGIAHEPSRGTGRAEHAEVRH